MSGWTANDMPDQTGRTVIVTGANSGLGFVTSRASNCCTKALTSRMPRSFVLARTKLAGLTVVGIWRLCYRRPFRTMAQRHCSGQERRSADGGGAAELQWLISQRYVSLPDVRAFSRKAVIPDIVEMPAAAFTSA
jgi:hypothetical protein